MTTARVGPWAAPSRPSIHLFTLNPFPTSDSALFMPGELSPADYYHYYLSSQRRVERWVRDTEKQLRGLQDAQKELPVPATAQHEALVEDKKEEDALRLADRPQRHDRISSKRRNDDRSGSRPSSGGPKKIRRVERHAKSPSRSHSTRRRTASKHDATIFSYLPYGVLPLLYALTGSTVVSFAVAAILLVGYLCVEHETNKSSPRRTAPR